MARHLKTTRHDIRTASSLYLCYLTNLTYIKARRRLHESQRKSLRDSSLRTMSVGKISSACTVQECQSCLWRRLKLPPPRSLPVEEQALLTVKLGRGKGWVLMDFQEGSGWLVQARPAQMNGARLMSKIPIAGID